MDEQAPTVVVVGASAGGVEALTTLASGLPEDVDAAICVVLHLAPGGESRLADILTRAGPFPRPRFAQPSGSSRAVSTSRGPITTWSCADATRSPCRAYMREMRPSNDVLFRSAALSYGRRTVAAGRLSNKPGVSENGTGEMSPAIAYADGAVDRQRESVEAALWTAISALQERAQLSERLAERVGKSGATRSQRRFEGIAEEARGQAETIRRLLAGPDGPDA